MRSDRRDVYKRVTAGNVLKIEEQRIDNRKRNKSEKKIGTIRNEKRIIKQRSPKQRSKLNRKQNNKEQNSKNSAERKK